jgi:hypothetical protein
MNLPNQLTVSRFFFTGLFLWAMMARSPLNDTLALVFFSLAGHHRLSGRSHCPLAQSDHQFRHSDGSAGGQGDDLRCVHCVY